MPAETHRHDGKPDREAVARAVAESLDAYFGKPDVEGGARLRDDLGFDDLGVMQLLDEVEHAFGDRTVGLSLDDDIADLLTVDDLVDVVAAAVVAHSGASDA